MVMTNDQCFTYQGKRMIPFAILEICTNKMIGNLRSYYDSVTGHIFERVPLYVHSVDHMRSPQKIVAIALHMQQELPPPLL